MRKIVYDENGKQVDELANRNEEIKASLEPKLQQFLDKEREYLLTTKKPIRWGSQFQMQLVDCLHQYPLMSAEHFVKLDADDIWDYYCKFHSLMAYYNMYTEIIPNMEMFMAFAGINMRMYLELKKGGCNQDEDIVAIINYLETEVLGHAWNAIDNGGGDVKAVGKRVSAKGVHEVISATEDKILNQAEAKSPLEMQRQLAAILGGEAKLLK